MSLKRITRLILLTTLVSLVVACSEEDVVDFIEQNEDPEHPVDGVYVNTINSLESFLVDESRPEQAGILITTSQEASDLNYFLEIESGDKEYEVFGVCGVGFCDPVNELVIKTTDKSLTLSGGINGELVTKSFTRLENSLPLFNIVSKTYTDPNFGSTLYIDEALNLTINSLYCTVSGKVNEKKHYYEIDAVATGCLSPIFNGDYKGVMYTVSFDGVGSGLYYSIFGSEQSALFGYFPF
ncbi:hypothetical protein [Enterovibrio calviensis]|uniref:hypothetical protein n=1 Tax=Enterovibrio calviensis TaxID=91359 RepID=UPI0004845E41|nr:hypothetical protein [Enterovibrio calviensis]